MGWRPCPFPPTTPILKIGHAAGFGSKQPAGPCMLAPFFCDSGAVMHEARPVVLWPTSTACPPARHAGARGPGKRRTATSPHLWKPVQMPLLDTSLRLQASSQR